MTTFQSFDSFEDAIDAMQKATVVANENLAQEQRDVSWGDYWARFDHVRDGIVIFGKVDTQAELRQSEIDAYGTDEAAQEDGYASKQDAGDQVLANYTENHERGYLFGRAYSAWEPRGELGDTHRANLWPISKECFEAARDAGWRYEGIEGVEHIELRTAFSEWGTHELAKARKLAQTQQVQEV